ncbi:MAG: YkgJ family cysteine cluster protein [Gammaproteobacteria bacterium]
MKPFFESNPLRFSCTRCGKCCQTAGEYYVFLSGQEAEQIRSFLGLSPAWFRRRYLSRLEDGQLVLVTGRDECCIFLDREGRCRIYSARPVQCRTYPFWPEVVNNRRNWRREARRCEGIDVGPVASKRAIRRAIRIGQDQSE